MKNTSIINRLLSADPTCQHCSKRLDDGCRDSSPRLVSSLSGPRLLCRTCDRAGVTLDPPTAAIASCEAQKLPTPEVETRWTPDADSAFLIGQLMEVAS